MNSNLGFTKNNAWLVNSQDIFQEEISYTSLTTFYSTSIQRYCFQFNSIVHLL
jgi:hypothetical protein